MNDHDQTNPTEQDRHHPEPTQAPRAEKKPHPTEDVEAAGTPDAIKQAESRKAANKKLTQVRGRGVDWVRPTDLIARAGGDLSRRGIDLTTRVNRRARAPIEKGVRWVGERARRLPPLSAFGRRGGTEHGPRRSGVGMK